MPGDWFLRPPSYERDLSNTENAHRALELFVANYGDTEFADDARLHFAETTDRLASYELYTAEFYTRRENPRAAALRAEYLIDNYPNAGQVPEALFLQARALIELGDVDQAAVPLRRLVAEFPEHPLTEQAADWLAAI
jgi:outer membrane protein assembly factor BamD